MQLKEFEELDNNIGNHRSKYPAVNHLCKGINRTNRTCRARQQSNTEISCCEALMQKIAELQFIFTFIQENGKSYKACNMKQTN